MRLAAVAFLIAQLPCALSAQGGPPPRDTVAQKLPTAPVIGAANRPSKLRDFYSRKEMGIGRFIERDVLANFEGKTTAEVLAIVPGVKVQRGGSSAYVASTRSVSNQGCAFCASAPSARSDRAAAPGCYLDTYVDGSLVYQMTLRMPPPPGGAPDPVPADTAMPKFDINSLPRKTPALREFSRPG